MSSVHDSLLKAAKNARLNLTPKEEQKLVADLEEILDAFSKIDQFRDYSEEPKPEAQRKMREDKIEKSSIDPFSNSKLVRDRKFIGPKLVD